MRFDPEKHHRRSIRLKGYDYSRPGGYFVSICTQNRVCLFGEVVDDRMVLNNAGQMIQNVWCALPDHYLHISLDEMVIMPNHVHGIIMLTDGNASTKSHTPNNAGAGPRACPLDDHPSPKGHPRGGGPAGLSLPDVVHRFKSFTTARYRHGVKQNEWLPFDRRLWQRNYYDHIIRNESDLNRIREYIRRNPEMWESDRNNPDSPCVDAGNSYETPMGTTRTDHVPDTGSPDMGYHYLP